MLFLRSLAFNIAFYLNLLIWLIPCPLAMVLPHRWVLAITRGWAWSSLWLMRVIAGIRVEFRGQENIPKGGFLVASKHQSIWETFAFFICFDDPAFVMKRELMWIPFFGWYAWKADMIPIDRGKPSKAVAALKKRSEEALARGRQIVLFPEGTRRTPGAPPEYKQGVTHVYLSHSYPCLPVALNSGLFWPRRQFLKYPGTLVVEYLPLIPAGLNRHVFFKTMSESIEAASNRLMEEARQKA
jgi:1-acyl-sn-glycerol-3-phosphate acyltransferase